MTNRPIIPPLEAELREAKAEIARLKLRICEVQPLNQARLEKAEAEDMPELSRAELNRRSRQADIDIELLAALKPDTGECAHEWDELNGDNHRMYQCSKCNASYTASAPAQPSPAHTDVSMLVAEWETEIAGLRAAWEQAVAERDAAKAEIAMLTAERDGAGIWVTRYREERDEAKAEIARLEKEHQEFRLQNDREWRAKLDHAKAEIARLETVIRGMDTAVQSAVAERDKYAAENQRFKALIKSETAWLRSLGPKDAKAEIARLHQAYRDEAQLRVALKPDTGE